MTNLQKLALRLSEVRSRLNDISGLEADALTDEVKTEAEALTAEYQGLEVRHRAAIIADGNTEARPADATDQLEAEARERLELRSKARLAAYVSAALRGTLVSGAEAELMSASGITDGIPLELFDTREVIETRAERAITPAPATVGVNMDLVRPAVFAPSIAERLMIDMPRVESGTYATGTIATSLTAEAVAKSGEVPQTEGAITVNTTSPHRVGASLGVALEDVAGVGVSNFESALRENVSMALSAELDDQLINGDITDDANNLEGMFKRLTDPAAPAAGVESWKRFVAAQSSGIDGLWATELSHVSMVVGVETYRLAAATFQGNDAEDSAAMYLKRHGADFWTNSRMPKKVANIQQGILCRKGIMGMRTAVAPQWGYIGIDDIYSGARSGQRYFTVSVLIGDVILVQPGAYKQVSFRVAT